MLKISLKKEDFDFLLSKIRFSFKKEFSFKSNPHLIGLVRRLEKSYTGNYLSIEKNDLDKVLYILNLSNIIDKRKKRKLNSLFDEITLNGFPIVVRRNRNNNPKIQLRKRKSNNIIQIIENETGIKPKEKGFPKEIIRYYIS